jgi:hypothetical protein
MAVLAACGAPTRLVEVPVAVEVPGPERWRPVPEALLSCPGRPVLLADGILGAQLLERAVAWQAFALCLEGRLAEIGALSGAPLEDLDEPAIP